MRLRKLLGMQELKSKKSERNWTSKGLERIYTKFLE